MILNYLLRGICKELKLDFKMVSAFILLGRLAFIVLMITQSIALATYPARYENHTGWYGLTVLYLPALFMWLCILHDEGKLRWLFAVWGFYTWLVLVPITGINVGLVDDNLEKNDFLGPNVVIMSICVSPLLFLLLLNNASDSSDFRKLVSRLSFQVTLDLVD